MRTRVYENNKTLVVRIPKDISDGLHVGEADIRRVGNSYIINPPGSSWREFFAGPRATEDFLSDRNQPAMQDRDTIE